MSSLTTFTCYCYRAPCFLDENSFVPHVSTSVATVLSPDSVAEKQTFNYNFLHFFYRLFIIVNFNFYIYVFACSSFCPHTIKCAKYKLLGWEVEGFFLSLTLGTKGKYISCIWHENFQLKQVKYLLTFGNYAVHKPHGEAKEDEVMQMVHLEDEINTHYESGKTQNTEDLRKMCPLCRMILSTFFKNIRMLPLNVGVVFTGFQ